MEIPATRRPWCTGQNDDGIHGGIRRCVKRARDNTLEGLADGRITRGELLRSARNICSVLTDASPVMDRFLNRISRGRTEGAEGERGEDAQFLGLKISGGGWDTPLDISRDFHGKGASLRAGE